MGYRRLPAYTQLAQATLAFDTSPHDLRIGFNGSLISVSWDGVLLMSAVDTSYATGFLCLNADSQPISYSNVQVSAIQNAVTLNAATPSSLVFSVLPGANPPAQTVNIASSNGSVVWAATSSASWLTLSASSNFTPGSITASVHSAGMAEGTYTATITLSAPGATNSPVSIPVTLAVKTAVLATAPASLAFFGATTLNPSPQTVSIQNAGTGNLGWTASVTSSWLNLSSSSGTAPASLSLQPTTTGLTPGAYSDTLTISSPDVANSPATIPVSLQVGTLLFTDNFSSGAGAWTISPLGLASGWSVANSVYSYDGGGHTQSWAGSDSWTNYTAALDFQLASLNDYPGGMRGRLNTSTGAGYAVWVYPAQGVLKLFRVGQWNIDAGNTLLAQSGAVPLDTNLHHLRLVFQGSTIQVYFDDALAISASDSTYTQGAIALDVSNQPIGYSNVAVIGF